MVKFKPGPSYNCSNEIEENGFSFFGYATIDSYQNKNGGRIEIYYLDTKNFFRSKKNTLKNIFK